MATNLVTLTASDDPSTAFTPTGDFEVLVNSGLVAVQTEGETGDWYYVTSVGGALPSLTSAVGNVCILYPGTSTVLSLIETGRQYRLVPMNGAVATASAWQLA